MAGSNPGMVIKVAADIADAQSAFQDIASEAATTGTAIEAVASSFDANAFLADIGTAEAALGDLGSAAGDTATDQGAIDDAVGATATAYGELATSAPADLEDVAAATTEVETATGGISVGVIAAGAAIGTFVADAVMKLGELVVSGIGAVVSGLQDIVMEGSDIADVSSSFDTITASVGLTADVLLNEMAAGTQGTIDNFELMKMVNRDVNAGMRLGTEQYGLMSKAAFALANVNGIDVKEAMASVNDAMLTGRTRGLQLQGVHVDLAAATKTVAADHHKLAEDLTDVEKLEASRIATLDALQDMLGRVGEQTAGLDEMVAQAQTSWANFKAELGKSINESGVLATALGTLKDALTKAFAPDQQTLVRQLTILFNDGVVAVTEFALKVIYAAETVRTWGATMDSVAYGIVDKVGWVVEKFAQMNVKIAEGMSLIFGYLPGEGQFERVEKDAKASLVAVSAWRVGIQETQQAAELAADGISPFFAQTQKLKAALTEVRDATVKANEAFKNQAETTDDAAVAAGAAAEAARAAAAAQAEWNRQLADMDKWSREIKNTNPWAYLGDNFKSSTLPALQAAPKVLQDVGDSAKGMAADVKFAAEVVQKASVTWSEAMDLVRKGQGTMGGTIGAPVRPAGMSDSEWALMQSDPRAWEAQHGYDWAGTHAGTTGAWSMGGAATTGGTTVNQSVTVNTVAGDKQAIATVVKDALASDWRSSGVKA